MISCPGSARWPISCAGACLSASDAHAAASSSMPARPVVEHTQIMQGIAERQWRTTSGKHNRWQARAPYERRRLHSQAQPIAVPRHQAFPGHPCTRGAQACMEGNALRRRPAGKNSSAMARALRVTKWVLRAPSFINAALASDERPPAAKRPPDPPEEGARSSRRHRHGAC